jgi:SAM-dependent methyltransferase
VNLLERLHERYIADRRARRLGRLLADALPPGPLRVLDVGCGDGRVDYFLRSARPELSVNGIDLQRRENACGPVQTYGGGSLPFQARDFDAILFVDVLHHTEDPIALLAEGARVARRTIVVKDHLREGMLAGARLRFMDRVGNRRFGVPLPFNFWRRADWLDAFSRLGVETEYWTESLELYARPLGRVFDSTLHFLARVRLTRARVTAAASVDRGVRTG